MEQRGTERESCACPARDSWQRHRRVRAGAGWGAWAAGRPGGHGQEQLSRAEGGGEPGDAAVRPHRTVSQATVGTRDSSLKVTKPTAERGRGAVGRRKTLAEARGPEGRGGGGAAPARTGAARPCGLRADWTRGERGNHGCPPARSVPLLRGQPKRHAASNVTTRFHSQGR